MRHSIATVSLSGRLEDKLTAAAAAGFDGVELFDNDLVASPLRPEEVAARCRDLGLAIELFQPIRDVEGVPPDRFGAVLRRVGRKLRVMERLGVARALVCSQVAADAVDDPALSADQLARLGGLAADHGVVLSFEALAWGRHISRVRDAWEIVSMTDHAAVDLAVDTFHLLARGDGPEALAGVPGERIGFLQVADAPWLDMGVLEWSRHHRCFPGQGTLDVVGVVGAVLAAGYAGPLSLEVFSDVVREVPPQITATDARRSLLHLEDEVARRLHSSTGSAHADDLRGSPPPPSRLDPAFVEVVSASGDGTVAALLTSLGFVEAGRHRSKPVTWWRHGDAHVVVNEMPGAGADAPHAAALGVVTGSAGGVAGLATRATALAWPSVSPTRGTGEAMLPGIASPSGLHVFVSGPAGGEEFWQDDFVVGSGGGSSRAGDVALAGLDHLGVVVPTDRRNEEVGFLRAVFGLLPGAVEEFMEPAGRLRSRVLRPGAGGLRVVLNVEDVGGGRPPAGVNQVAFACPDVLRQVRELRRHGVPLVQPPDNYYDDLAARFDLSDGGLAELREHGAFYDREAGGDASSPRELVHAYTDVLAAGFYVELVERRGGYDGYGSPNTHVRLAVQR